MRHFSSGLICGQMRQCPQGNRRGSQVRPYSIAKAAAKTRQGKIMLRLLRERATGNRFAGDMPPLEACVMPETFRKKRRIILWM